VLPGQHTIADYGVLVHLNQAAGFADATALGDVSQDGDGILLGQACPEQGRPFAFREAGLASRAIQHPSLLVGAVAITDAQVTGAAFSILGTLRVLTTKVSQLFHGTPSVAHTINEQTNTGSMVISSCFLCNTSKTPGKIETFHKLMKSAGLQMEEWQQRSARAISKRLLVASMTCVVVWQLERLTTPAAETLKEFLMRLSGRQTKRSRPITTTGLLAGLHVLITMLAVLEQHTPEELREFAKAAFSPNLSG
jgi:hypothetical protein